MSLVDEIQSKIDMNKEVSFHSFEVYMKGFLLQKGYADKVLKEACKKASILGVIDCQEDHRLRVYRSVVKELSFPMHIESLLLGAPLDVVEYINCHYQKEFYRGKNKFKPSPRVENEFIQSVLNLTHLRREIMKHEEYYISAVWEKHLSDFDFYHGKLEEKNTIRGEVNLAYEQTGEVDAVNGFACREEIEVTNEMESYFKTPGFISKMPKELKDHLYHYYQSGYYGKKLTEQQLVLKK